MVQGEGLNLGTPSTLIRLSQCNLRCDFCDSKYTWQDEKEMSIDEVIAEVNKYNCHHIMISGGEPLLQQDDLIKLMEQLLETNLFYTFEIESNGTIVPKKRLAELTDLFTISPKFNQTLEYNSVFNHIEDLAERPQIVFKFVVDKGDDFAQILTFVYKNNKAGHEVFLMPCATSVIEMAERLKFITDFAKEYNFRVTPRLQILTYGNKRGT